MGLDYSFLVMTPAARVDPLLESIAPHLAQEDQARLRAAFPWSPSIDQHSEWLGEPPARDRRGICKLQRSSEEVGDSYCFTFHFPRDALLTEYERSCLIRPRPSNPWVAVGCVWCSIQAGDAWAVFEGTAATSDMSRLFEGSPSVRATWLRIFKEAGATALFFDSEDLERWTLIHPTLGQVARPDAELYELEDSAHLNTDAYVVDALRLANVNRPG